MTANDIERIEQAARSVFGHDDGEASVAHESSQPSWMDRLRAVFRRDRGLPSAALAAR